MVLSKQRAFDFLRATDPKPLLVPFISFHFSSLLRFIRARPDAERASIAAGLEQALKPFEARASDAETRLEKAGSPAVEQSGSETSSSAMKDLQSKLDAVSAEFLAEKEKNRKLVMENEKLNYRISHLIRAMNEAD